MVIIEFGLEATGTASQQGYKLAGARSSWYFRKRLNFHGQVGVHRSVGAHRRVGT